MTTNHLLSATLFSELFQHNLVSPDGRIIANDRQLRDYSTFLIQQSKDRVSSLYAERKNMVNDVEDLLRLDIRTKEEENLLKRLINELDLEFEEDGLSLGMKEPRKPQKRYLGPKEPKKSLFERKIEAELRRVKTLKRDLRTLDDWLEQMSHLIRISDEKEPTDWKEAGKRFRQRTTNRMCDMENARMKLIKSYYDDYDKTLKRVLYKTSEKKAAKDRMKAPDVKEGNDGFQDDVTEPRSVVEGVTEDEKPTEQAKDGETNSVT